jgi:hypothetical protein
VLELVRTVETRHARAFSLDALGIIHRLMGNLDLALTCKHRSHRAPPGPRRLGLSTVLCQGKAALDIAEDIANPRVDASTHTILAKVHLRRGDQRQAERY